MKEKKILANILETYKNSAEDFYYQMKKYYQGGIVSSVKIPYSPKEVKTDPQKAVNYILTYKILQCSVLPSKIASYLSFLFELGPCLFKGDEVKIQILDLVTKATVENSALDMENNKNYTYTVKIALLKDGSLRKQIEENIHRDQIAQVLKESLAQSVYSALRELVNDGLSDNPQKDLEIAQEVASNYGIKISQSSDVEKVLDPVYFYDFGLKDLEEIYVFAELLKDESFWIYHDCEDIRTELVEIINKKRQSRIDSPIIID